MAEKKLINILKNLCQKKGIQCISKLPNGIPRLPEKTVNKMVLEVTNVLDSTPDTTDFAEMHSAFSNKIRKYVLDDDPKSLDGQMEQLIYSISSQLAIQLLNDKPRLARTYPHKIPKYSDSTS